MESNEKPWSVPYYAIMVCPLQVAKEGAHAFATWDLLRAAQELYRDAELLRDHAVRKDEQGNEHIVSPKTFSGSVRGSRS